MTAPATTIVLAVVALAALTATSPIKTAAPESCGQPQAATSRVAAADLGEAAVKTIEDVLKGLGFDGSALAKTVSDVKALPKGARKDDVEKVLDEGLKSAGLKAGKMVLDAAVDAIFGLL